MSSDRKTAVSASNVTMRYGETVALDNLTLSIPTGIIASLLGRNGAGKTTLLETCEGYRSPHTGTVRVLDRDPIGERDALSGRVGVMLQAGGAWSGVKAREMLTYAARLYTEPQDLELLWERLGLAECGATPYRRLSGGLKQRLHLALSLIGRPELVFIDEPTAGLDPHARRDVWQLLRDLRSDGVSVVLTTHYLEEAEALSDQVYVLDAGRLLAQGSVAELTASGGTLEDAFLALTEERR